MLGPRRSCSVAHPGPNEHLGNHFGSDALDDGKSGAVEMRWALNFKPKEIAMNWDQIEGRWKEFKGNAQAKWGEMTDDELDEVQGNREALEGKIQQKYGKSKEEAKKEVDEFIDAL